MLELLLFVLASQEELILSRNIASGYDICATKGRNDKNARLISNIYEAV